MVEKIIEFCARNRFVVLLGVAFAFVGAVAAIQRVKLDAIPDLSDPQVIVFTEWMGRSPTLIEDQITYPIVSSLVAAPHVTDVRGFSMFGMSFIYVVFEEGTDIYWARSRVLEYMNGLQGRLPEGVTPVIGPDATGIGWVFQYALVDKSGRHGLEELRTFQDYNLRYALGSVPGVAEVASVGGYEKQYQVTVDPNKLRAFDVTMQEVISAIRRSNNDVGGRIVEMSGREYYVRGQGYIQSLDDIEKTAVKVNATGTPVLVRDLGSVRFGPDIRRGVLEWNGEGEAVGAIVVMRFGENALEVIERVKKKLEELKPTLPEGVTVEIAYDRSGIIERSIETLKHSLVEEMIVVSLIIILFLLHVRSSLLPILSLPIAVSLSFIPMYLLDIPSTIMSLGGIAIAIGATVDAEIVMIEASHKKLEHAGPGADRSKLLAEAAREVAPAIFFSLLIIAVAFLPVFTLTGQAGRLFKPLAYTKTFVMLFSALLSITFAPAMRDLLIRGRIFPENKHPVSRFIIALYRPFVYVALRRPVSTVAIGLLAMLSAVPLAAKLGHEFMPPLNEGDLLYMPTTALPNISIEEAKKQLQYQDRVLRGFPEVTTVFGKVGRAETPTDPAPLTMVETTVQLKPRDQWRKIEEERWYSSWWPEFAKRPLRFFWPEQRLITWEELTTEMNQKMQFPGWTNAFTMPIKTRVDMLTTGIRTPIGIKVFGNDLAEIEKVGTALEGLMAPIAGTRSVLYERSLGGLYVDIIPNRDALARYGLVVGDVQDVIEAAIGGTPITTTVEGRNRFSVNVRYPQDLRDDIDELKRVLVPTGGKSEGMGSGSGAAGMGAMGWQSFGDSPLMLAQNMQGMQQGSGGGMDSPGRSRLPDVVSDAPMLAPGMPVMQGSGMSAVGGGGMGGQSDSTVTAAVPQRQFVPLGQLADIKIAGGPPMIRDEDGLLVGYVYVDVDPSQRDIGGYVDEAKQVVAQAMKDKKLELPAGYFLKWTGQYELLEEMNARMKVVIPITLLIVIVLLVLHFKNLIEALIVLLSIPFALVGSVWLLWLLDYRISTAVWVGVIALIGLAAQTGIVMIVYIDNAYERRKRAGKIRNLQDIIHAHTEGTVLRVRPKLMTVATMLMGLIPLLWASGSGSDVMKRIAAPMVGGLLTSAFLTLEIIPVVYTYWRREQLLWERLAPVDSVRLLKMKVAAYVVAAAALLAGATAIAPIYVVLSRPALTLLATGALLLFVGGVVTYLALWPAARHRIWPEEHRTALPKLRPPRRR